MLKKKMSVCVAIPFYNRLDLIQNCLNKITKQLDKNISLILIDDGSKDEIYNQLKKNNNMKNRNVFYIKHEINMGVPAARNTSIKWCREHKIDILIMVDSDCDIPSDFISTHVDLHLRFPDVACFGAGVNGIGKGHWASVDRIMSWVPSMPYGEIREQKSPYFTASANISMKLNCLPHKDMIFNTNVITGEDVIFISELRRKGEKTYFSPKPCVNHQDKEKLRDVIRHSYMWGRHIYFVQLGDNCSPRCYKKWYRVLFSLFFFPALPAFALLGAYCTLKPWLKYKPLYVLYLPSIIFMWLLKSVAVLNSAINPFQYLASAKHYAESRS